jgi:diketogulonate reductase-like aldo/keto reductase
VSRCSLNVSLSRRALLKLVTVVTAGLAAHRPSRAQNRFQRMRPIPSSGEQLPAMGLGTYRTFDVGTSVRAREPIKEVLRDFVALGGRVIDSSPMYGRAEAVVGDLAAQLGAQDKLFYATKVWTSGREDGIRQMERSMQRMRTQHIDLMQIHNLVDWQTHLKTLREWKEQGRIRYIGITHYTHGAFEQMEIIIQSERLDFIQFPYNIMYRYAEQRLLPLAAERGVAVLVNEPFEQGTLFGYTHGKPVPAWAADFDCTSWAQFFLKYILAHPAVTCAIPATSKPKHLLDNMQAGLGRLPNKAQRTQMVKYMQQL